MSTASAALQLIASADLAPTEHLLLNNFIEAAVDSDLAARYLLSRIQTRQDDVESCLRRFKRDWRRVVERSKSLDPIPGRLGDLARDRDGPRCSLTKYDIGRPVAAVEPAYLIPPSMLHGIQLSDVELLEAFLSPEWVADLRSLLSCSESDRASLQNIWRLSPSIHRAFRDGHVNVESKAQVRRRLKLEASDGDGHFDDEDIEISQYRMRTQFPDEPAGLFLGDGAAFDGVTHWFKLCTPDARKLPLVSEFLFDVHCRVSDALHLCFIEDRVGRGWPSSDRPLLLPRLMRRVVHAVWLWMPAWVRVRCYFFLARFGKKGYGSELVKWVERLPFGLVLKECVNAPKSEPNALRLVQQYTSIPAPRVVDVAEHNGSTYLVMTRLPGQLLADVFHLMSYAERDQFADDLKTYVSQLRQIPNKTPYLFADTLGGPYTDHRIPDGSAGPFNSEADFNAQLTSHLGCTYPDVAGDLPVRLNHRSYFTHSNLSSTNLLVENGRLSGIQDWESAGFKPEYWEFTKAMYHSSVRGDPPVTDIFRRAFGPEYDSELEIERRLWLMARPGR